MNRGALPVTVIGGYLGAGKTTVLNHLLRHANGRRIAVLVNDFGQLAIDADLIEAEDEDMISIAGGCICCSFGDDLTGALGDMAARVPQPDHVVIETSGVAMPGAIAANIGLLPALALAGVIVLADAETVTRQAQDEYIGDTILRQLAQADLIALTKVDLLDEPSLARVGDWVAATLPGSRLVKVQGGEMPVDILLGQMESAPQPGKAEHADRHYESLRFAPLAADPDTVAEALGSHDLGLLRAKGFLRDRRGRTHLLQLVGRRCEIHPSDSDHPAGVVCIGLKGKLKREALTALFGEIATGNST